MSSDLNTLGDGLSAWRFSVQDCVPWSEVRSIGDEILQVLTVSGLRDTARTRGSISRGPMLRVLGVTRSIWAVGTAHTPSSSQYSGRTLVLSVLGVRDILDTRSKLGV